MRMLSLIAAHRNKARLIIIYDNAYQFNQMSAKFGCFAPAMRQEIFSTHLSDFMIFLIKFIPGSNSSAVSKLLLLFPPFKLLTPLSDWTLLPKLFGTKTGWLSSSFSRVIREKNIGNVSNENNAGNNMDNLTKFNSIRNLRATTSMRSFSLKITRSMALMKPSAFSLAIPILTSANIPILDKSMDIFWLLGWRISAIIGTGRDDCGIGSLYQPTMSPLAQPGLR